MPAFEEGIKQGKADVEKIKNNQAAPTFENTIVALDEVGRLLTRTSGIFFNLNEFGNQRRIAEHCTRSIANAYCISE